MSQDGVVTIPQGAPLREEMQTCADNAPVYDDACYHALPRAACVYNSFEKVEYGYEPQTNIF